jgi:hypothetical protein
MTVQHTDAVPAHQRTLIAVARVHADAIHSLHTRTASRLDDHSARLLRVLDEELARVLQRLGDTLDGKHPPANRHDDGPTIAECAEADRVWPLEKAGE